MRYLIFFFTVAQITIAMEHQQDLFLGDFHNKPIYSHNLFDLSKKTKDAFSFVMMVSPVKSDNSVLIGTKDGIISQFSLNTKRKTDLIQHHFVTHIPLFVAVEKKGALLLVSVGNHKYADNGKRSECCIWHGCLKTKYLKPLQAIAVDKHGDLLVTADQWQTLSIIDLNNDKEVATQSFLAVNTSERFVDVAFSPDSTMVIVARTSGIALMDWSGGNLKTLFNIKNILDIKNIYFLTHEKLLYTTYDKKVKQLNILDALNKTENDIKPMVVFEALVHNHIVVDEDYDSAALWTKNKNASDHLRHEIVVRTRHNHTMEEVTLEVPPCDEKYEYESKRGCLKYSNNHLCEVALQGNNVVALCSDGTLHWWKTAADTVEAVEVQPVSKKNSPSMFSLRLPKTEKRNRSKSESPKGHKKSNLLSSFLAVRDGDSDLLLSPHGSSQFSGHRGEEKNNSSVEK